MDIIETRCENTSHNPNVPDTFNVKLVTLTEDFESEVCVWCEDCRRRDADMIESEEVIKDES